MKIVNSRHIKTNTLILGVFVFLIFTKLLIWLPGDVLGNSLNLWVYTDWLIDYSSGFTRRGLSGELLNLTSTFSNPRAIIGLFSWLIFSGVVFGYVRLIKRSIDILSPSLLIALLFLPSFLPFYLYDHAAFGRKETLGFLFLLWHLYLIERFCKAPEIYFTKKAVVNKYLKSILLLSLILLPMHVFIHESSFFLFVPAHAIITYSILRLDPSINSRRRVFYLTLIYLPVILAISIVFIFGRTNFNVALAICDKWELANALEAGSCNILGENTMWALPGSLTALPWSFSQAASLFLSIPVESIMAWLLVFSVLGFSTVYVGSKVTNSFIKELGSSPDTTIARHHSKIMCFKYFLLPLFISMPLYYLGWDFGRWFAVSCINFAMISLSREINYAEIRVVNGVDARSWVSTKNQIFEESVHLHQIKVFFLLLIIFFIRLPHCCNQKINMLAEPIWSLAKLIVRLFQANFTV